MVERGGEPEAGPDAGFTEIYRSQYASMVRLAGLLLGDYPGGEEVAQDAFARLLGHWDRAADPTGYLRTTVVNLCRSRIRRLVVARRHPPRRLEPSPGPEEATESLAVRAVLRAALGHLSVRQREAVVLRFYAGLSDREIAEAMGVTLGSVKSHLHRALATLSTELEALR